MPSVLFVCTANQFRSPIAAAAFLKQLNDLRLGDQWVVASAGTWVKAGLAPHRRAILAAQRFGLNIEDHRTCPIRGPELSQYDLILVMEQGHKEALLYEFPAVRGKVYLISEFVDSTPYDVPDPADPGVGEVQVAGLLNEMIRRGYSKIIELVETIGASGPK